MKRIKFITSNGCFLIVYIMALCLMFAGIICFENLWARIFSCAGGTVTIIALYLIYVRHISETNRDLYEDAGLQSFQISQGKWSDDTFGKDVPPRAKIAHLIKEVDELYRSPYDIEEYADCFILILDAARKAGYDVSDITSAMWDKLEVNRQRKWGKPDENGVVEHIRE